MTLNELVSLQKELQGARPEWGGYSPERGRNQLLWLLGEAGEVIDIVKRNTPEQCAASGEIHDHLVEELADVMMYFVDVMGCYGISAEEFSKGYRMKHDRNMKRDFAAESPEDEKLLKNIGK